MLCNTNVYLHGALRTDTVCWACSPLLCSPGNYVCGYALTVVANCAAPGGPWVGCGSNATDDGSLRLLHSVTMRSSLAIRSVGPECLGLGAACSIVDFGGSSSAGLAYRFALPATTTGELPPLLLWAQLPSKLGNATLMLCQEPLGGPNSRCSASGFAPPFDSADAIARFVNGTAVISLANADLTGSGRPYFQVFVSLPVGKDAVIAQVRA